MTFPPATHSKRLMTGPVKYCPARALFGAAQSSLSKSLIVLGAGHLEAILLQRRCERSADNDWKFNQLFLIPAAFQNSPDFIRNALVVAGFVAQSGRTTSFIMASLVHAGVIDTRRALPVVVWSNFGCTLVIFAAVFPLHLFALFLLAVAGACVAFERPKPLLNAATATFGLALMLFGLKMTSSTASLLTDVHGFSFALSLVGRSLLLAFATGLLLTLIAQSHMAIMLIAVALAAKGVMGVEQTLMLVCGTYVGSGLITFMTGIHFHGVPRQLVIAQILYNFFGVILFLALFAAAHALPGMSDLVGLNVLAKSVGAGNLVALFAVAFNLLTPLVLTAFLSAFYRLCARLAPPKEEDELARPQFLNSDVVESPVVTLILAEQEQLRLLKRLPQYCDWLREGQESKEAEVARYSHAFNQVAGFIERSEGSLMSKEMSAEDTEWLLNQQKRQQMLSALHESCHELWLIGRDVGPNVQPMRASIVEALDTFLLTAIEGMANRDAEELALIETMTTRQNTILERVRKKYLTISDSISDDERGQILQLTSTFERAAWSVGSFAKFLRDAPEIQLSRVAAPDHARQSRDYPLAAMENTYGLDGGGG
jgi:phosphate:Na+ symporter